MSVINGATFRVDSLDGWEQQSCSIDKGIEASLQILQILMRETAQDPLFFLLSQSMVSAGLFSFGSYPRVHLCGITIYSCVHAANAQKCG